MSLSSRVRAGLVPETERRTPAWIAPAALCGVTVLALAAAGLMVARVRGPHLGPFGSAAEGMLISLALFVASGDALAVSLVPREWGAPGQLLALPIGAAVSGLALTAFGLATVPLHVSLWVVLAAGVLASAVVRRRRWRSGRQGARPAIAHVQGWSLCAWLAALAMLAIVALAPAWRTGMTTIYGENPDAHQVVGAAVLLQHVPPTHTDVALPIDTVPPAWRFRYPILYPLAAVSTVARLDPITVFPAMAALLLLCVGLGFGAFAVLCLRAPPWAGPLIAGAVGLSVTTLHIVWHPYWNQLWGLAMFPWALLFGWRAVVDLDRGAAALFALMLLELGLAYPLALPYPVLIVGALAVAYQRYRLAPGLLRSRSWVVGLLAVVVLAPAVAGAAVKLGQGVEQLLSSSSGLWGGDITTALPIGDFVGTGGGLAPALAVLAVALASLLGLPRRHAVALGVSLAVLCLLDLRFRLASEGAYMDFKHLSFVGALALTLAASGVTRLVSRRDGSAISVRARPARSGRARSGAAAVGGGLALVLGAGLALVWAGAALPQGHDEMLKTEEQVTPEMLQIRQWARELPPGASVRVDIPPSGLQLWAVYMLGDHPVDAPHPVLYTTYAHAIYGVRASYSLSLRYVQQATPGPLRSYPRPIFAVDPPLHRNSQFVLRQVRWPKRLDWIHNTASTTLVEP